MRGLRRRVLWFLAVSGAVCWVGLAVGLIWRRPLAAWVLRRAFVGAGIEVRDVRVSAVGLHRASAGPIDLAWRGQRVRVDSLRIDRPDLMTASLGRITVEGLTVDLDLSRISAPAKPGSVPPLPAAELPRFVQLSVDGTVTLHVGDAAIPVKLAFSARPDVTGKAIHAAVAFSGAGTLDYDLARSVGRFAVENSSVDLEGGRGLLDLLMPDVLAGWDVSGRLGVSGDGHFGGGPANGEVHLSLRGGAAVNPAKHIRAEGIQADVVVGDLANLISQPGQRVSVATVRVGSVQLQRVKVGFALNGLHRVELESGSAEVFGGRVSARPFSFDPTVADYSPTFDLASVQVAQVMALFPSSTASATGQADGEVAVHYGPDGLRLGRGWLGLHSGSTGTLQLQEPGLLTANVSPESMAYPTLKAVETGLTNLRVNALRVDIHPLNAPAGRSVQIHVEGQPMDATIKAPVTFDVNVNGPVEKLIQWGLDSRMNFSPK